MAEISVAFGGTSVEACKLLLKADEYYLFDFEERVRGFKRRFM